MDNEDINIYVDISTNILNTIVYVDVFVRNNNIFIIHLAGCVFI